MKVSVSLFVVAPSGMPEPASSFEVEAASDDQLRTAAADDLRARGLRVRAVSFGPLGLTAYAERES